MLFFNKKYSLQDTGIFDGFVDYHSHILPGVDDGIQTMDAALAVLSRFETLGIRKVWLTPHIMEDIPNKPSKLETVYKKLCSQYLASRRDDGKPIELCLAAEHMIDSRFVEVLANNEYMPYGDNKDQLLVETSYVQAPYGFRTILQDVQSMGLTPVLAHPERYMYMDYDMYDTLKSQGIRFQLNVMSLAGAYGEDAKVRAEYLLEEGYYSYKGTDIHSLRHFDHTIEHKTLKKSLRNLIFDKK